MIFPQIGVLLTSNLVINNSVLSTYKTPSVRKKVRTKNGRGDVLEDVLAIGGMAIFSKAS